MKPTMSSKIPTINKSSNSTQAHLLPSTSSVAATSSESQPPIPLVISTFSASNSLCTSTKSMFTALSAVTQPSALETTTSTSNTPPSTIIFPVSQASKQNIKNSGKKRKSSPIQDTDDEDMIVHDIKEQMESTKEKYDKYFLSEEDWKNETWGH
ncbi:hypothetical protein TNCV_1965451 [Trichonephila clavipes]|nr:hypothetical protein TNCV_1965451 [Trichonephila clavipes]